MLNEGFDDRQQILTSDGKLVPATPDRLREVNTIQQQRECEARLRERHGIKFQGIQAPYSWMR